MHLYNLVIVGFLVSCSNETPQFEPSPKIDIQQPVIDSKPEAAEQLKPPELPSPYPVSVPPKTNNCTTLGNWTKPYADQNDCVTIAQVEERLRKCPQQWSALEPDFKWCRCTPLEIDIDKIEGAIVTVQRTIADQACLQLTARTRNHAYIDLIVYLTPGYTFTRTQERIFVQHGVRTVAGLVPFKLSLYDQDRQETLLINNLAIEEEQRTNPPISRMVTIRAGLFYQLAR